MCPFTGRISGQAGRLETADVGRADAGRQEDVVGAEAAAIGKHRRVGPGAPGRQRHRPCSGTNRTPAARQAAPAHASRARLSTWWSPGTSIPPRSIGVSEGTRARHSEAVRRCAVQPSECW